MPERNETLMRTRCPECGTIFRVTSGQLRLKAGKVRCGQCQSVFNAFDHLQPDNAPAPDPAPVVTSPLTDIEPIATPPAPIAEPVVEVDDTPVVPEILVPGIKTDEAPEAAVGPVFVQEPVADVAPTPEAEASEPLIEAPPVSIAPFDGLSDEPKPTAPLSEPELEAAPVETPEETTLAAREAGLVAARELIDTAAYNRWAAGTLAGTGSGGGFTAEAARRPVWPFAVVLVLLLLLLAGQVFYHYRTDMVARMPSLSAAYQALGIKVPLPHDAELVTIESSDLQADNGRGLFVLQATLRNRAAHAQAWPTLELTLTDVNDAVVSRRVINAADYLSPGNAAAFFAADSDTSIRLWIEARDIGAAGYRLYVFYP